MRKASILVLALLMIVGTLALVYLEKSAAQAQQQPAATDTKKSPAAAKSKDFPRGNGYSVSRMWRVPSGNLPRVRLRVRI